MKNLKEIRQLNDYIQQNLVQMRLPFLLKTGRNIEKLELIELKVSFKPEENGFNHIDIVTHVFNVHIQDEEKCVEQIELDFIHYNESYGKDFELSMFPSNKYFIYYDDGIYVSSYIDVPALSETMSNLFSEIKFAEYFHETTGFALNVIEQNLIEKQHIFKEKVLKWFPFIHDIEYDGYKNVLAFFNNNTKLQLDFDNLMLQIRILENGIEE